MSARIAENRPGVARVWHGARGPPRRKGLRERVDAVSGGDAKKAEGRLVVITGLPGSGKTTLAIELAAAMPAARMCPDDWMMVSGIDLWDVGARARIEQLQLELAMKLLRAGQNVVIEWGVWARVERDALRDAARENGASVELRYVTATPDELWRRIVERDLEGKWGSRSITRSELDGWSKIYTPPSDDELATYDDPHDRPPAARPPDGGRPRRG